MKTKDMESTLLFQHFGTRSPLWYFRDDSDALHLSGDGEVTATAISLRPEQADAIRKLTGVTSHLTFDLKIFNDEVKLHLVGKKTDKATWAGTAADYYDTDTVARDLEHGLMFAEQVVSEVNSLVVILDADGKIKRFNRLCEELTGLKEENLLGLNAHDLFMPVDEHESARANIRDFFATQSSFEVERPVQSRYGIRKVIWRNKLVESGSGESENFLVCSGTDVTEERRAKERLMELATKDTLTGLLNRHAIQEMITEAITAEDAPVFSLLFLDLDNFKKVNDHYGHVLGDCLIQAAASAIHSCLREGNVIARLGGDEFLIVIPNANQRAAELIAERIHERMKVPFDLNRAEIYSSCSIGIAVFPEHGRSMEELIRNADMAMYAAKDSGRNTHRIFTSEMDQRVSEYVWLDTNIRKALEENQFELYYQAKQSLTTGKVESVEALIRWNSPERGLIQPMNFIPYAEESGLITPIGKWVMETAARQAGLWKKQDFNLRIAINLSARQFRHPKLVEDFKMAILAADIYPSIVDLELTESCLIEDETLALKLISQFKDLGAEVHLDDFGTGYSSLSQLSRLPLDVLKLDRSFISSIHNDIRAQRLLRSMVAVAQELQLKIVAEGVETQDQAEFLRSIGVDLAQGFLFAKPMPAAEFEEWFRQFRQLKSVA
ncbi:cyclic di-GMP phosphodiesterase [Undibacterium terreum]|uniref:Cyclic di-GMP phosphodiesterase n=1 Tax=Undibacterium terreum TaxID=1224302 RepID=A0A916ULL4_9BURK|nr:cyclic di-GMP phosphodiesterase [Undibacterium terreum]GGC78213.1 cyclic di-GMP phosphodiesterase [Undibacterium terreum]